MGNRSNSWWNLESTTGTRDVRGISSFLASAFRVPISRGSLFCKDCLRPEKAFQGSPSWCVRCAPKTMQLAATIEKRFPPRALNRGNQYIARTRPVGGMSRCRWARTGSSPRAAGWLLGDSPLARCPSIHGLRPNPSASRFGLMGSSRLQDRLADHRADLVRPAVVDQRNRSRDRRPRRPARLGDSAACGGGDSRP